MFINDDDELNIYNDEEDEEFEINEYYEKDDNEISDDDESFKEKKKRNNKNNFFIYKNSNNIFYINKDIKQEKFIKDQLISVSSESKKKILFQMENCMCKIKLENGKKGIGFLCKIPFNNNLLPFLITNNYILNITDNNINIKLIFNNGVKKIKLDNS